MTGLVEIPASWYLDDLPPMMFIKKAPNSHGWVNPRDVEELCMFHATPLLATLADPVPRDGSIQLLLSRIRRVRVPCDRSSRCVRSSSWIDDARKV